uniref:Immunoglobulin I-set domain-containing protein n=1 Tax=Amphilophus citrinellus TaxID=61819 RepID=A0A3Q0R1W7_AMPCI
QKRGTRTTTDNCTPSRCTLKINDPQLQDHCHRYQYLSILSHKELREKGPPEILQELRDVLLVEGNPSIHSPKYGVLLTEHIHSLPVPAKVSQGPDSIKAEISGEPPPVVAWTEMLSSFRVFFDVGDTNTMLTMKNAKLLDAGNYEVFVENNLGTDPSSKGFARVWAPN